LGTEPRTGDSDHGRCSGQDGLAREKKEKAAKAAKKRCQTGFFCENRRNTQKLRKRSKNGNNTAKIVHLRENRRKHLKLRKRRKNGKSATQVGKTARKSQKKHPKN
jgi:hypothetical protein